VGKVISVAIPAGIMLIAGEILFGIHGIAALFYAIGITLFTILVRMNAENIERGLRWLGRFMVRRGNALGLWLAGKTTTLGRFGAAKGHAAGSWLSSKATGVRKNLSSVPKLKLGKLIAEVVLGISALLLIVKYESIGRKALGVESVQLWKWFVNLPWLTIGLWVGGLLLLGFIIWWLVSKKPWQGVGLPKNIFKGLLWTAVVVGGVVGFLFVSWLAGSAITRLAKEQKVRDRTTAEATQAKADSAFARIARGSEPLPYPDSGEKTITITVSVDGSLSRMYAVPAGCNFNLHKLNQGAWIKIVTPNGVYDDMPGYDLHPLERIPSFRLRSLSGPTRVELTTTVVNSRQCRENQNSASHTG
jgi:hypothetical protein